MKGKNDFEIIYNIFSEEIIYYKKLLNYTLEQEKVIERNDIEGLEWLLKEKEEIIKEIDELEETLKTYRNKLIEEFNLKKESWLKQLLEIESVPEAFKEKASSLIDVMVRLYETDKKNQQLIVENRLELMNQRSEVKRGMHVNKSYNNRARIYSSFIDRKG